MNLNDVFTQLTYGELSKVFIGGLDERTGILEIDREQIISHVQLGLTDLYRRFRLLQGQMTLTLQPDTTDYMITKDFIASNTDSTEAVKYLTDDPIFPYEDNLLKIVEVKDDLLNPIRLNWANDSCSVFSRSEKHLYVPEVITTLDYRDPVITELKLIYLANHPKIDCSLGTYSPELVELYLPDAYMTALLYYITSRYMNPIGMANEFHAGNSYYAKYEGECARLEQQNLQYDNADLVTPFERDGWC